MSSVLLLKKERKMKDNKKEYINEFGAEHIKFIAEQFSGRTESDLDNIIAVSYTHLTLPTTCSV